MESKNLEPQDLETKNLESNSLEPINSEAEDLKPRRPRRSGQRKSAIEIASMARAHTPTVINMLVGMVVREDVSPTVRINAGLALLDRGWGKPLQKVELEGDRPSQITEIINYIVDPKDPESPIRILGSGSHAVSDVDASEATLVPNAGETDEDTET